MVPWNSRGFVYIWQSMLVGIIGIKTERTQSHFLSDVLVVVASLDLKVPTNWWWQWCQSDGDDDDDDDDDGDNDDGDNNDSSDEDEDEDDLKFFFVA